MKFFTRLFHLLSGIYFAIFLIAIAAATVIAGTVIESRTTSHLFAARWTYEHPFFQLLLALFFINILFSSLRRWPFKKKHIPFLITHLGLLMIIGGTILKNRLGLQGQLFVWEGSGNQYALLPQTYALNIEGRGKNSNQIVSNLIPLQSFQPNIYHPFDFPSLKCKVIGYATHVKEQPEAWIKNTHAYITGFSPTPVHTWDPSQPLPQFNTKKGKKFEEWSILALRTAHIQEALLQIYLQNLYLQLKTKEENAAVLKIPLKDALQREFSYAGELFSASLNFNSLDKSGSSLILHRHGKEGNNPDNLSVFLQGSEALFVKSNPIRLVEDSLCIDLCREHSVLCVIEDEQKNNFLYAFDLYGRIYGETYNPSNLQQLVSYNQGFGGYSVQVTIPFPNFPSGREDKNKAEAFDLTNQLKEALFHQANLAPPLQFFKQACQLAGIDFAQTFVQFLVEWNRHSTLLFNPAQPLSPSIDKVLNHLNWNNVTHQDQQAILWINQILTQLETDLKKGESLLTFLEKHHWPFITEFQTEKTFSLHLLTQQIAGLTSYLPSLEFSPPQSNQEQAQLLSAFFRAYGIDYRSLSPKKESAQEQFDALMSYWEAQKTAEMPSLQTSIVFEAPLAHRIIPEPPPIKIEEQRPGIVLEVQQGQEKHTIALAYDPLGIGLKWPILNGRYIVRFQSNLKELPYRIRLRQARQISYPQSPQVYSYESDLLITENGKQPIAKTLSMNHVYETWDGYRFYLAGVATASKSGLKHIQLAVNHDPAKYILTYPGAFLVFIGIILLFWVLPYRKKNVP